MTGKWFKRFVAKCADNVPVAIDIYMDGWKVSNLKKAVGLYFTIANLDKSLNWKVTHKFSICLIPLSINLQHVLPMLLADVGYKLVAKEYTLSLFKGEKKMVKVEIARVIGDTPGIAEFCGVKNHRCGGIFFFPTRIFFFDSFFFFSTFTFLFSLTHSFTHSLTHSLTHTYIRTNTNCSFTPSWSYLIIKTGGFLWPSSF